MGDYHVPWNLLLLPLLGGYLFTHFFWLTRYRALEAQSDRLLLGSAASGALFLAIVRGAYLLLSPHPWTASAREALWSFAPLEYAPTAIVATLLAFVAAHALNAGIVLLKGRPLGKGSLERGREWASMWVARRYGNQLLRFLLDAFDRERLVMVTLKNEKVYVGRVQTVPRIGAAHHLMLLPVLSGTRDDRKRLDITTRYSVVLEALAEKDERLKDVGEEDFYVVLPVEEILTATPFNLDVWEKFFGGADRLPKASDGSPPERAGDATPHAEAPAKASVPDASVEPGLASPPVESRKDA